ncbi:hypothetical protein AURDEDRAFT_112181 [Auricularia subglabra TFB-10046 SS5]|nr:hypothetical protein AURDEDRAFT_112181 [Auricularia subglabra TFB-10046 SS5]
MRENKTAGPAEPQARADHAASRHPSACAAHRTPPPAPASRPENGQSDHHRWHQSFRQDAAADSLARHAEAAATLPQARRTS